MLTIQRLKMLVTAASLMFLFHPAMAEERSSTKTPPVLPRVHAAMEQQVQDEEVAGAVTIVVSPDRILSLDAVGEADREKHLPMRADSIFWIASMTKPVTGLAISKLQEQGKLQLHDPVEKYIPEFKNIKNEQGEPVQITLLQMLTHTSGLRDVDRKKSQGIKTLKDLVPLVTSMTVKSPPGSKWEYNQAGINMAGRIVEVVSGMPFDEYLHKEFFQPLKMVDTTFYLTEEQLPRLAQIYCRTEDGKLVLEQERTLASMGLDPSTRDRLPLANGGLFSTAPDYAKLCQMLLNEGELNGRRYLKPETVKQFRTIQTAPEIVTGFTPGNGWGVGCCVLRTPQGLTESLSPGTFGHGGAFGTQVWIDPVRKQAWVLMVQRSNFKNSDASVVRDAFQDALFPERP